MLKSAMLKGGTLQAATAGSVLLHAALFFCLPRDFAAGTGTCNAVSVQCTIETQRLHEIPEIFESPFAQSEQSAGNSFQISESALPFVLPSIEPIPETPLANGSPASALEFASLDTEQTGNERDSEDSACPVSVSEEAWHKRRVHSSAPAQAQPASASRSTLATSGSVPGPQSIRKAVPLKQTRPEYPNSARKAGCEGTVLVRVEVLSDGRVGQVALQHSSGFSVLDHAALQAAREWQLIPAQIGGQAVASWASLSFQFALTD